MSMGSPFADILQRAVEATPRAIGGAFAASDGEMVDYFIRQDPVEWALLTAHYGVILAQVQSALNTWHYGETDLLMFEHSDIAIIIQSVQEGYYALLAVHHPAPLGRAITALGTAAHALRREMS